MLRIVLIASVLIGLAGAAQAQGWREPLAAADRAMAEQKGEEAVRLYRAALAAMPEGRDRIRVLHGLADALLRVNDLAGAEPVIEEARGLIAQAFGRDDIAMAGNRQRHGVVRLRKYNDRDGARDAFAEAARIRAAKVDAWDESEGPLGGVKHNPSGLVLPPRAGALVQFRRDVNDDDGTDVSVAYRATGRAGGVSVTLYIYRPAGDLAAVWAQEMRTIRAFNPAAVLRSETAVTIDTKAGPLAGRVGNLEYVAQNALMGTRLYVFPLKADYVKLRVTFRLEDGEFIDAQVGALLAAVGWPPR